MTTENEERDTTIKSAIVQLLTLRESPSYGLVAERLPSDFDLLESELTDALAELRSAGGGELPEIEAPSKSLENFDAPRAPEQERPKITRDESQARIDAAHVRHGEAVVAVKIAEQKLHDTQGALVKAVQVFNDASDPLTPEQRQQREVRNHLAAEAALRARRGPSSRATQFVQKRMRNGPTRGAYSMQQAARVGFRVKP